MTPIEKRNRERVEAAIRELEKAGYFDDEPSWQTTTPTEPGWWWVRNKAGTIAIMSAEHYYSESRKEGVWAYRIFFRSGATELHRRERLEAEGLVYCRCVPPPPIEEEGK